MKLRTMVAVPIAVLLATVSCSSGRDVSGSEAQFDEAFLRPLDMAGLDYQIDEVCHYERRAPGEPWHLQIAVSIDASPRVVARALAADVDIIRTDRDPMVLQQFAGRPGDGWDGSLEAQDQGTLLGVAKNNVAVDGDRPPIGWLPICDHSP